MLQGYIVSFTFFLSKLSSCLEWNYGKKWNYSNLFSYPPPLLPSLIPFFAFLLLLLSFYPNLLTLLERRNPKQHCRKERIKQEKPLTSIKHNFFWTQRVIISHVEFIELFNASKGWRMGGHHVKYLVLFKCESLHLVWCWWSKVAPPSCGLSSYLSFPVPLLDICKDKPVNNPKSGTSF